MIELRALGTVTLLGDDGRPLHSVLTQPKRLALLLYLAAASPRTCHRRDRLLALFWPELDEERARAALRQAVYHLRRSIGERAIISRGESELGVDPECVRCDVVEFERELDAGNAETALARFGGALAEGLHVADAPEFERWLSEERLRLGRRAAAAAWDLAEAADGRGDAPAATEWARRAIDLAPEDEAGVRWLIAFLDRQGDRAAAIRAYEQLAARLREELDAEPSAETQAVIRHVRERAKTVGPPPPAVPFHARDAVADIPSTEPIRASSPAAAGRRHQARRGGWVIAGAVAALAAVAVVGARDGVEHRDALAPDPSRALVLPLENRTGDAALEPLGIMASERVSEGLHLSGIVGVAQVPGGIATSGDGTKRGEWMRSLARRTGAATVVWGGYYLVGDSVQVQVQIADLQRGQLVQALSPVRVHRSGTGAGMEQLRDRTVGAVASVTDRAYAALIEGTSHVPNSGAHREFMLGVGSFVERDYPSAIRHFEGAMRADSLFQIPLHWLAFSYGNSGARARRDSIVDAMAARRERFSPLELHALDYFLAESRSDQGAMLRAVRNAAALAPRSQWTYMVAHLALKMNRPAEARDALLQLQPERDWVRSWVHYWNNLTTAYHLLADHRSELEAARRGRRLDPKSMRLAELEVRALAALGRVTEMERVIAEASKLPTESAGGLGSVLQFAGMELHTHVGAGAAHPLFERAVTWTRAHPSEDPQYPYLLALQLYYANRYSEAQQIADSLVAARPDNLNYLNLVARLAVRRRDTVAMQRLTAVLQARKGTRTEGAALYVQAAMAALEGDKDRAVALLRESYGEGGVDNAIWIDRDIDFESLRRHPPFMELMQPRH